MHSSSRQNLASAEQRPLLRCSKNLHIVRARSLVKNNRSPTACVAVIASASCLLSLSLSSSHQVRHVSCCADVGALGSRLPGRSIAHRQVVVGAADNADFGPEASGRDDDGGPRCLPALEEWLRSYGGVVNGVQLRPVLFPSGAVDRQLVATADHPAGSVLISVPRLLQIRYDNVEAAAAAGSAARAGATVGTAVHDPLAISPADADAITALYDMMPRGSDTGAPAWQFKQALTLLYHLSRGSASPLLPYLSYLPGLAPGVPTPRVAMLMHDDAVDELQYGAIVQDVRNQKYWLRQVSREVLGRLHDPTDAGQGQVPPAEDGLGREKGEAHRCSSGARPAPTDGSSDIAKAAGCSRRSGSGSGSYGNSSGGVLGPFCGLKVDQELFGWAVAVAMSRCFGLTRFHTHTCVPLVDMANHVAPHSASNCEIRSGPEGEVVMTSKRPIRAGEELTLTYGSHDNHNLLLSYGFTQQPNPNDAFWFDINMETIESLVEGCCSEGGPAPWQRHLLSTKVLGAHQAQPQGAPAARANSDAAAAGADGDTAGGDGAHGSIRVYLAAPPPPSPSQAAATVDAIEGGGGGGGGIDAGTSDPALASTASTAEAQATAGSGPVRQPVDPRLLAALRIATLDDEAWSRVLAPLPVEQIGAWTNLLARQQEITLMRLLASLVTALYTTFPTTIQQDRQLLAAASTDVAAAAAAVTLTSTQTAPSAAATPTAPKGTSTPSLDVTEAQADSGDWVLRPHDHPIGHHFSSSSSLSGGSGSSTIDPSAAAVAAHARDMAEAVRFRLGLKTTLERCLQALVARAKELDALQKVR